MISKILFIVVALLNLNFFYLTNLQAISNPSNKSNTDQFDFSEYINCPIINFIPDDAIILGYSDDKEYVIIIVNGVAYIGKCKK
jgi:hypothetical protein